MPGKILKQNQTLKITMNQFIQMLKMWCLMKVRIEMKILLMHILPTLRMKMNTA